MTQPTDADRQREEAQAEATKIALAIFRTWQLEPDAPRMGASIANVLIVRIAAAIAAARAEALEKIAQSFESRIPELEKGAQWRDMQGKFVQGKCPDGGGKPENKQAQSIVEMRIEAALLRALKEPSHGR